MEQEKESKEIANNDAEEAEKEEVEENKDQSLKQPQKETKDEFPEEIRRHEDFKKFFKRYCIEGENG